MRTTLQVGKLGVLKAVARPSAPRGLMGGVLMVGQLGSASYNISVDNPFRWLPTISSIASAWYSAHNLYGGTHGLCFLSTFFAPACMVNTSKETARNRD
jgi:hypothetical protein